MTAHHFDATVHPFKGRSACAIRPGQADDAMRLAILATQVWLHTYATEGVSNEIAHYVLAELRPAKFSVALGDTSSRILVAEQGRNLTHSATRIMSCWVQPRDQPASLQARFARKQLVFRANVTARRASPAEKRWQCKNQCACSTKPHAISRQRAHP